MGKKKMLSKAAQLSKELNIKPCPFCGGEARIKKHPKMINTWYVQCNDCGVRTPYSTQAAYEHWETARDYPIRQWNSRIGESENKKPLNTEGLEPIKVRG